MKLWRRHQSRGVYRQTLIAALLVIMPGAYAGAASPLGGRSVTERLDRRADDRQLDMRITMQRLHESLHGEMMQPQARQAPRVREWQEDAVPQPQRFDDRLDKLRRVRATLY